MNSKLAAPSFFAFALALALMGLSGCVRGGDRKVDEAGPAASGVTHTPAAKRSALNAASHGGVTNVTRTKVVMVRSPKTPDEIMLQDLNVSMRKSHEIFTEVWAHIWKDRMQKPMSVFSEVGRMIQAHVDPATGKYLMKVNRCADAVPRASEIEIQKMGGITTGAVFYRLSCGQGHSERSELGRMVWKKSGDKNRAEWTFYAENMPRSAGASLAFLKERIRCNVNIDEHHKMDSLECQNLGQNRDTEMHMRFDRFNYKRGSDTLVLVEGKKYKLLTTPVCDEPRFCTQMKVPLVGSIDIFEDVVSEEGRDQQKRVALEAERKEAQAELEKRITEQKLAAEKQAKDLKTRGQRMQVEGSRSMGASPVIGSAPTADAGAVPYSPAAEAAVSPAASGLPGTPFGGQDGFIAPASNHYAPPASAEATAEHGFDPSEAEYQAPQSAEDDPAAAGVYDFNHDPSARTSDPQVERQAAEGAVR